MLAIMMNTTPWKENKMRIVMIVADDDKTTTRTQKDNKRKNGRA